MKLSSNKEEANGLGSIIVYRNLLLPYSETWIVEQAEKYSRLTPIYVGRRYTKGLELPPTRTALVNADEFVSAPAPLSFDPTPSVSALMKLISETAPIRVINAHFGIDAVSGMFLSRLLNKPLVVTYHGYDACLNDEALLSGGEEQSLYFFWRKELFNYAALILASSDFLRQRLIAQGCPANKILTHYIGIDLDKAGEPPPLEERENFVLFVARLVEKKGCADLLAAMRIVQDKKPLLRCVIVGDGAQREELQTYAKELNLNCSFLGALPHGKVKLLMQKAFIFCVPSVTAASGDSEGLGIVFLEAQAAGLPVVSTRHGGIPEAVVDGETGFLVPEREPTILAERILELATDKESYQKFKTEGRARVSSVFNLSEQSKKLEDLFLEIGASWEGVSSFSATG